MYENKYLQSHYANFFTLFLLVASDNSVSNSQGYQFLSVHTSKLMVLPPFFQSVDKRTEICRGELSSKCCLGGWRQQKLGCSLGPQGDSPPPHTPTPPFTPPSTPPPATGCHPQWCWRSSCHTDLARDQPGAQSNSRGSKMGRANHGKGLGQIENRPQQGFSSQVVKHSLKICASNYKHQDADAEQSILPDCLQGLQWRL